MKSLSKSTPERRGAPDSVSSPIPKDAVSFIRQTFILKLELAVNLHMTRNTCRTLKSGGSSKSSMSANSGGSPNSRSTRGCEGFIV